MSKKQQDIEGALREGTRLVTVLTTLMEAAGGTVPSQSPPEAVAPPKPPPSEATTHGSAPKWQQGSVDLCMRCDCVQDMDNGGACRVFSRAVRDDGSFRCRYFYNWDDRGMPHERGWAQRWEKKKAEKAALDQKAALAKAKDLLQEAP